MVLLGSFKNLVPSLRSSSKCELLGSVLPNVVENLQLKTNRSLIGVDAFGLSYTFLSL